MQQRGLEDLLGLFVGEFKLRAVILEELHVTAHGLGVLVVDSGQHKDVVVQESVLGCGGEDLDKVVGWR